MLIDVEKLNNIRIEKYLVELILVRVILATFRRLAFSGFRKKWKVKKGK